MAPPLTIGRAPRYYERTMLDIYTLGEEVLTEKAKPVKTFDSALALLVDAMFETMEEADGVGLAAPQVGVSERLFVIDVRDGKRWVFINPEIIGTSEECETVEEGCLSIPGIFSDVTRAARVTVQAQNLQGKPFTVEADGLFARAIQHELDHLNGVLFIDHLDKEEHDRAVKAFERRNKKRRARA